eukprot:GILJ01001457.1.p1 GENE.GILJ01001457.1~~GILJ01001457.1.p1  ORF type:complete len:483 (+),score=86.92 GILJ01001457.1:51-1499(+)
MARLLLVCLLLSVLSVYASKGSIEHYLRRRVELIGKERSAAVGGQIHLDPIEKRANAKFLSLVNELRKMAKLPSTRSFFESKADIEASRLFATLKAMPKGGVLHAHTTALADAKWIISHVTYDPRLYMTEQGLLQFTAKPEKGHVLVSKMREEVGNAAFDSWMYDYFTFNGTKAQGDSEHRWPLFQGLFSKAAGAVNMIEYFPKYMLEAILSMARDNVNHLELRHVFGLVFDLEKGFLSEEEEMDLLVKVIHQAQTMHPDLSIRVIYCGLRVFDKEVIRRNLQTAKGMAAKYPQLVAGFDLVGEEDTNHPTMFYAEELMEAQENGGLPYYFHGGESIDVANPNLYDLLLLGTKRVGHGLALVQHPMLLQEAKRRGVAVEICPISNHVLGYVDDLQTHPAVNFLAAGVAVTISSDDPAWFQYTGVTHDWAMITLAWKIDLSTVKQLLLNSLQHSTLEGEHKDLAIAKWTAAWSKFVAQLSNLA